MESMILAAGAGTRLRPLTNTIPKALVEVAGRPILGRVIERLVEAGATRIVCPIPAPVTVMSVVMTTCSSYTPAAMTTSSPAVAASTAA